MSVCSYTWTLLSPPHISIVKGYVTLPTLLLLCSRTHRGGPTTVGNPDVSGWATKSRWGTLMSVTESSLVSPISPSSSSTCQETLSPPLPVATSSPPKYLSLIHI